MEIVSKKIEFRAFPVDASNYERIRYELLKFGLTSRLEKEIIQDLKQQQILLTTINSKLKEENNTIRGNSKINAYTEKITQVGL